MFDEKSTKWIKLYKMFIIVSFWVLLLGGVLLGILDCACVIDVIYEDGIDVVVWSLAGATIAFWELLCGMLILSFLNNVQIIREKIEKCESTWDGSGC